MGNELERICHFCKSDAEKEELRPYGPGGAWVCFTCAMQPENIEGVEHAFMTLLDAAASMYTVIELGGEEGPSGFNV